MDYGPPPLVFPKPAIVRPSDGDLLRYGMPREAMLPGMAPIGAAAGFRLVTAQFIADYNANANTSSYTKSQLNGGSPISIGAAFPGRVVVIGAHGNANANGQELTGVTLGGNAMSPLVLDHISGGGTSGSSGLYARAMPSGTTASISVNFNSNSLRVGIGVWVLDGARTIAAYDTASDTGGTTFADAINVPGKGHAHSVPRRSFEQQRDLHLDWSRRRLRYNGRLDRDPNGRRPSGFPAGAGRPHHSSRLVKLAGRQSVGSGRGDVRALIHQKGSRMLRSSNSRSNISLIRWRWGFVRM